MYIFFCIFAFVFFSVKLSGLITFPSLDVQFTNRIAVTEGINVFIYMNTQIVFVSGKVWRRVISPSVGFYFTTWVFCFYFMRHKFAVIQSSELDIIRVLNLHLYGWWKNLRSRCVFWKNLDWLLYFYDWIGNSLFEFDTIPHCAVLDKLLAQHWWRRLLLSLASHTCFLSPTPSHPPVS